MAALTHVHQFHPQDDGIYRLHHGGGGIGGGQALEIAALRIHLGGEHLGAALTAKEDGPLVKDSQTGDLHRTSGSYKGVSGDAVEVPHIHRVKAPVEGDRFYVDVRIQQLGAARLHRHSPVNDLLAAPGGVNPQVFNAILIGRYSVFNIFR